MSPIPGPSRKSEFLATSPLISVVEKGFQPQITYSNMKTVT